jgi:hypothetical protein
MPSSLNFKDRIDFWLGDQDSNLDNVLQRHVTYH